MAFDWRNFFRAIHLTLTKRPLTLRRASVLSAFLVFYPLTNLVVRLGMLLDHLFFPGFRKQEVVEPFYIMGNPRSGTTFMQNTFALDEEHYTHLKLRDILVPSITLRKVLDFLGRCDRALGGPVAWIRRKVEGWIFHGVEHIHPMALDKPEEDAILILTFASGMLHILFPFVEEMKVNGHYLPMLDFFPEKMRKKHMDFYEGCIKRHLYAAGGKKRLLSKNTLLAGAIASHLERFPDAKILYLARNPLESIASLQSMMYTFWRLAAPEIPKDGEEIRSIGKLSIGFYRYSEEMMRKLPEERMMALRYDDFVADNRAAVEKVYAWLGQEMTESFRKRLDEVFENARKFRSRHHYRRDEFGMRPEEIYAQLTDVFERFGWEAPPEVTAAQEEVAVKTGTKG